MRILYAMILKSVSVVYEGVFLNQSLKTESFSSQKIFIDINNTFALRSKKKNFGMYF